LLLTALQIVKFFLNFLHDLLLHVTQQVINVGFGVNRTCTRTNKLSAVSVQEVAQKLYDCSLTIALWMSQLRPDSCHSISMQLRLH
jgi:hypothetical protein